MNNMVKFEILEIGKTYKMSGFNVICIKQKKSGLYKMQTLGMTAGTWPGDGDVSDYNDVTKAFAKEWAGIISKFRLPSPKQTKTELGKKALIEAAQNHCSFGTSNNYAWLGNVNDVYDRSWYIIPNGNVYSNRSDQNISFVIAPSFDLNPSKIIVDGDEIKKNPGIMLKPGEKYKMSGFDVICIKLKKDGLYKMQTLGMTAGKWPGNGNISDYDDVTKAFAKEWAGVISKFRLPKRTGKIATYRGKTYKALIEAAKNYDKFGASDYAWLGTPNGGYFAWCVYLNGYVYNTYFQNYSCVVAPCFNLDPSKIRIDGDEIKRKSNEAGEKAVK